MTVHPQSFALLLDLTVSNTEVDDEAAKQRPTTEFENPEWGKTEQSLWYPLHQTENRLCRIPRHSLFFIIFNFLKLSNVDAVGIRQR